MFNSISIEPWSDNPPASRSMIALSCLCCGMFFLPAPVEYVVRTVIGSEKAFFCVTQLTIILCMSIGLMLWRNSPTQKYNNLLGTGKLTVKTFGLILIVLFFTLLAVGIVTALWQAGLDTLDIPYNKKQYLLELVPEMSVMELLFLGIMVCILAPLTEELMFRRLIYSLLLPAGFATAFWGTALLFSLLHFFIAGIPGLLILGVVFQFIYLYTHNWWSAVILHGLVNLTTLLGALV